MINSKLIFKLIFSVICFSKIATAQTIENDFTWEQTLDRVSQENLAPTGHLQEFKSLKYPLIALDEELAIPAELDLNDAVAKLKIEGLKKEFCLDKKSIVKPEAADDSFIKKLFANESTPNIEFSGNVCSLSFLVFEGNTNPIKLKFTSDEENKTKNAVACSRLYLVLKTNSKIQKCK